MFFFVSESQDFSLVSELQTLKSKTTVKAKNRFKSNGPFCPENVCTGRAKEFLILIASQGRRCSVRNVNNLRRAIAIMHFVTCRNPTCLRGVFSCFQILMALWSCALPSLSGFLLGFYSAVFLYLFKWASFKKYRAVVLECPWQSQKETRSRTSSFQYNSVELTQRSRWYFETRLLARVCEAHYIQWSFHFSSSKLESPLLKSAFRECTTQLYMILVLARIRMESTHYHCVRPVPCAALCLGAKLSRLFTIELYMRRTLTVTVGSLWYCSHLMLNSHHGDM